MSCQSPAASVTLAFAAAALAAFFGSAVITRTGTRDGCSGLTLPNFSALEAAFSDLAALALDGDGVVEMLLVQLNRATDLPAECVQVFGECVQVFVNCLQVGIAHSPSCLRTHGC